MIERLRTVRGYRPEQLAARVLIRGARRLPWDLRLPDAAPPLDAAALERLGAVRPIALGPPPGSDPWTPGSDATALEAFERHYHAWLVPLVDDPAERAHAWAILGAWLERFPPSRAGLALAWHPYVVSSRVRPWAAVLAAGPPPALAEAVSLALWQGLAILRSWPERDVAGNHLLRNATALTAGAALFAGPDAAAVRALGERRLEALLPDQFADDGAHVERSTGYQALALDDLLDVLATVRGEAPETVARTAARALGWLRHVAPAGRPRPELNDSAPELGPPTAELLARAEAIGLAPARRQPDARTPRLVVLGDADTRLLVDCDQPSRPDLPYHAHADSLGVVLSVEGVALVVDRGVATYEPGAERTWWRSTAAHSTVEPAGGDTSELHGAFRAGRLAHTEVFDAAAGRVTARHDGAGRPALAHVRRAEQVAPAAWVLTDAPASPGGAVARLHLPPGADVELRPDGADVAHGGVRLRVRLEGAAEVVRVDTLHALGLGRTTPAPTIQARLDGAMLRTLLEADG